ncbi:MAG: BamA/TamA family outer membrane protein [Kiritimatiellae bacterium]|nr:BamA/TamA family outer membrane protein [Kiritimatiellia bacterium]
MRKIKILSLGVVFVTAFSMLVCAQNITLKSDEARLAGEYNWLPYGFYTKSLGLTFGVGMGRTAWPQEQASLIGTLAFGTKGTYFFAGGGTDIRVPGFERLFVDIMFSSGYYVDSTEYINGNPDFKGERAGSNESSQENFIEETLWDSWAELRFFYLLPMGDGADHVINTYRIDRGILASGATGGKSWNPLKSGRTYLRLTPAWRNKTLDLDDNITGNTFNLKVGIEYNNLNFPYNPTCGSKHEFYYTHDFTSNDRLGGWELYEIEYGKVFDLGTVPGVQQHVLALDFWTAYVPTWETETVDGVEIVTERPPYYEGANLGGFYRMRAYEGNRFHDKAAIYGSIEYRIIPKWQPLLENKLFKYFELDWMQFAVFAEAGRVAPEWTFDELTTDMKFDAGVSLRGMLMKSVFRLDLAVGEEGSRVVAMYGQPF